MSILVEYPPGRKSPVIEQISASNHALTIMSTYKGLILTHPIQILDILPDRVIMQAPEHRLCFTLKGIVYLYSHTLPETITAQLLELNMTEEKLTLSDLTFTGQSWKERLGERIQPRDQMCVDIAGNNILARTQMENLSVSGMRVMISKPKDKEVCTDCNAPVRLAFQLPGEAVKLELEGTVMNLRQIGNLVIVGIRFFPSPSQEKQLNQYILARKVEILDELEWAFQKMFQPRQVQDLYF